MRALLIAAAVSAALAQQPAPFNPVVPDSVPSTAQQDDSPEAYPGQHEHREPPADFICHRPPLDLKGDQAKWCSCERVYDPDTQVMHTDEKCAVNCWEKRNCSCPMSGEKKYMPSEPVR